MVSNNPYSAPQSTETVSASNLLLTAADSLLLKVCIKTGAESDIHEHKVTAVGSERLVLEAVAFVPFVGCLLVVVLTWLLIKLHRATEVSIWLHRSIRGPMIICDIVVTVLIFSGNVLFGLGLLWQSIDLMLFAAFAYGLGIIGSWLPYSAQQVLQCEFIGEGVVRISGADVGYFRRLANQTSNTIDQ